MLPVSANAAACGPSYSMRCPYDASEIPDQIVHIYGTDAVTAFFDSPNGILYNGSAKPTSVGSTQSNSGSPSTFAPTPYLMMTDANNELWSYPVSDSSTMAPASGSWTSCAAGYRKAADDAAINMDGHIILDPCNNAREASHSSTDGEDLRFSDVYHRFNNANSWSIWIGISEDGQLFAAEDPTQPWVKASQPGKIRDIAFRGLLDDPDGNGLTNGNIYALSEDGHQIYRGKFAIGQNRAGAPNQGTFTVTALSQTGRELFAIPAPNVTLGVDGTVITAPSGMPYDKTSPDGNTTMPAAISPLKQIRALDHRDGADGDGSALAITGIPSTNTPPTIAGAADATIEQNGSFDPRAGVTATDMEDGDLTGSIQINGSVDAATPGEYTLTYTVADSGGLAATVERKITVKQAAGTTIACAPQTGADPASSVWQTAAMLMGLIAFGLAFTALRMQRQLSRRI